MTQTGQTICAWAVVGAGPAGILAVAKLLDAGIPAEEIIWFDPEFNVGDFGTKWYNVPSNTKVKLFEQYLLSAQALGYTKCPADYQLGALDPNANCLLAKVAKPLNWITRQLREQVCAVQASVTMITKHDTQYWQINCQSEIQEQPYFAKNCILAIGAEEKQLPTKLPTIDMATALNPELLAQKVAPKEAIAVYGASHSAVLIIKNLIDLGCRVINFYKHPLKYALYQGDHILYDNTGLKGLAAEFAREFMEGQLHPNLTRYSINHISAKEEEQLLAAGTRVVSAIGFKTKTGLIIEDIDFTQYDPHTGIIAAGLYGFGIAFPQRVTDQYGISELSVGLYKFTKYLTAVLPIWLKYGF